MSPKSEPRYNDAFLDSMRQTTDPLADSVAAAVLASGQVQAVNHLMKTLIDNDGLPPEKLPDQVRDYLAQSSAMPAWADPALIQAGERVFWRYGPEIIAIFYCYSLPFCYAGAKGVQVLWLTTRLASNATRRIVETAQMIIDVMKPGGLGPQGTGIRSAQKVRLMHAAVRCLLRESGRWNPALDEPVNQEDMGGTLMSFSWVVLDGLRQLGFHLTPNEQEAYLHSWKVVGHVLGIRPDVLPANISEAEQLARTIQRRQYAPSPEGQEMTRALIDTIRHIVPGNLFDSVPESLMRWFLGDRYADMLGVSSANAASVLMKPLEVVNSLFSGKLHAAEPIARVHEVFGKKLIEALLLVQRGGERPPFSIPAELRQTWGVNWT